MVEGGGGFFTFVIVVVVVSVVVVVILPAAAFAVSVLISGLIGTGESHKKARLGRESAWILLLTVSNSGAMHILHKDCLSNI